jgi:Mg2+ and Co2+ transporter CorA
MLELLNNYSVMEIITFIILLSIAVKGVVDFIDWIKGKLKALYTKEKSEEDEIQRITNLETSIEKINKSVDELTDKINLLVESDKDAIKAYITKEHHYYCYERQWIDDYSLDCLEKRFAHYIEEKGNSFVENLMDEIRALPREQR